MKIVVGEFMQETNSFCPVITGMEDFALRGIHDGPAIRAAFEGKPCALGGMLAALDEAGAQVVLARAMTAQSGGMVEHAVLDGFLCELLTVIQKNQPVDGVFLSCHGATQTTTHEDGVGYLVETVRTRVGVRPAIALSTDLHANITGTMVRNADIICGYHTYPHVDFYETGYRAARLGLSCCAAHARKPVMAWVSVPMIVPASAYTTTAGPFAALLDQAQALLDAGTLLDVSIYQMQPWLDVKAGGSAVLAVARDACAASECARTLAGGLYALRKSFVARPLPVRDILERALKNRAPGPVVLADSADSSNAGAAGDSAEVLRQLLLLKTPLKAALALNDAPAARRAYTLGVGTSAEFTLGASIDRARSQPVRIYARVLSLHEGVFTQEGPAGRGIVRRIGQTAVLRAGEIDIIVCESMTGNGDPQLFRAFGVEPTAYRLVAVKACASLRAAYASFAAQICEADTPGAASTVLTSLPFARLPHEFYPFTDQPGWKPSRAVLARADSAVS